MTDQKEEMNTDGNNDCYLLRSPTPEDQHGQQGARNGYKFHRAISPFRTTLEKVLVVVTFILFIVCIVFVVLFAVEKSKASESVSNDDVVYDEYKGKRIYITSVCTQTIGYRLQSPSYFHRIHFIFGLRHIVFARFAQGCCYALF